MTHVFDYLARDFKLGRQEAIQWKGADGVDRRGHPDLSGGLPAGTEVSAGGDDAWRAAGGRQVQHRLDVRRDSRCSPAKATRALQPNYRGSTGYGDAFLRDMVGHYFQQAHLDVMTGADEVIRRGIADPDRMVKMGWSGGGHMTNKIITFTDRFKAASSGRGRRELDLDVRAERHPRVPHAVVRRHAVAEERADRPLLEPLAAEGRRERQDADAVLRRRTRPARADAAID